jgi:hypothetical protein
MTHAVAWKLHLILPALLGETPYTIASYLFLFLILTSQPCRCYASCLPLYPAVAFKDTCLLLRICGLVVIGTSAPQAQNLHHIQVHLFLSCAALDGQSLVNTSTSSTTSTTST